MKFKELFFVAVPVALSAGCIHSHRVVVYRTAPTSVVAPASERPTVRVYQETPAPAPHAIIVEPITPGVVRTTPASADLTIADTIRQMFDADPSLASRVTNARISVSDNRVTLEGTVPTRGDKAELQRRLLTIPSIVEVNNRLDIAVSGR